MSEPENKIQVGHHVRVEDSDGSLFFEGVVVGVGPIGRYDTRAFDIVRDDGTPGCGVDDGATQKASYRLWKEDPYQVTRTYREVIDPGLKVGDRVGVVFSVRDEVLDHVDFVGTVVG